MRLTGIETEYGLAIEGRGAGDQMDDAAEFVAAYPDAAFAGWDYRFETPRSDLRGFKAEHLATDPGDAQWDAGRPARSERELRADRVLSNGARLYNDHGHPELATPECARLLDLVAHDAAGDLVMLDAAQAFERKNGRRVWVYKNNTDFHGASYGTHENYLVSRSISPERLIRGLLPLLVTRQVLTGAGKVGSEARGRCHYQLSQRADFITEVVGVDTLYRRPIFNTRDEPHADSAEWLRLHVICGDANRLQWATAIKVGMVALALDLIEAGEAPSWSLRSPVEALSAVSRDEELKWQIPLEGGSWTTAIDVLDSYLSVCEALFSGRDAETDWVVAEWRSALNDLQADPMLLKDRSDWALKLSLLNEFARADGRWEPDAMMSLDLEYHNLRLDDSLFGAAARMAGAKELVDAERAREAVTMPPANTRAFLRGKLVSEHSGAIMTIGWKRAVLKVGGKDQMLELPPEPKDWNGAGAATDLEEFLRAVARIEKQ